MREMDAAGQRDRSFVSFLFQDDRAGSMSGRLPVETTKGWLGFPGGRGERTGIIICII